MFDYSVLFNRLGAGLIWLLGMVGVKVHSAFLSLGLPSFGDYHLNITLPLEWWLADFYIRPLAGI